MVENALYHGIKSKRGMGHIAVKGRRLGNLLLLTVEDDGMGMTEERLEAVRRGLSKETDSGDGDGSACIISSSGSSCITDRNTAWRLTASTEGHPGGNYHSGEEAVKKQTFHRKKSKKPEKPLKNSKFFPYCRKYWVARRHNV